MKRALSVVVVMLFLAPIVSAQLRDLSDHIVKMEELRLRQLELELELAKARPPAPVIACPNSASPAVFPPASTVAVLAAPDPNRALPLPVSGFAGRIPDQTSGSLYVQWPPADPNRLPAVSSAVAVSPDPVPDPNAATRRADRTESIKTWPSWALLAFGCVVGFLLGVIIVLMIMKRLLRPVNRTTPVRTPPSRRESEPREPEGEESEGGGGGSIFT